MSSIEEGIFKQVGIFFKALYYYYYSSSFVIAESASLGCNSTQLDCFGDGTMCIDPDRVCDGVNDCGDWEDEPKGP